MAYAAHHHRGRRVDRADALENLTPLGALRWTSTRCGDWAGDRAGTGEPKTHVEIRAVPDVCDSMLSYSRRSVVGPHRIIATVDVLMHESPAVVNGQPSASSDGACPPQ